MHYTHTYIWQDLTEQASQPGSALKKGRHTSKTKAVATKTPTKTLNPPSKSPLGLFYLYSRSRLPLQ